MCFQIWPVRARRHTLVLSPDRYASRGRWQGRSADYTKYRAARHPPVLCGDSAKVPICLLWVNQVGGTYFLDRLYIHALSRARPGVWATFALRRGPRLTRKLRNASTSGKTTRQVLTSSSESTKVIFMWGQNWGHHRSPRAKFPKISDLHDMASYYPHYLGPCKSYVKI